MQTLFLEVRDDLKDVVLSFLRTLPHDAVTIYEDIDTDFTPEDENTYQQAIQEKEAGQSVSLGSLKKKYGI